MKIRIEQVITSALLTLAFGSCGVRDVNADRVVIPELSLVGNEAGAAPLFSDSEPSADQSQRQELDYPRQLSVDIYGGRIEGFIAFYSETTRIEDLIASVSRIENESKTYPDLERFGIWQWRNNKDRYSVQVTQSYREEFGPQLTVVWLDRKGSISEEAVEITKALIEEAVESTKSDKKKSRD